MDKNDDNVWKVIEIQYVRQKAMMSHGTATGGSDIELAILKVLVYCNNQMLTMVRYHWNYNC